MDPRTLTIPGQWAADAQTIIPAPPIPGVAYRNPALDAAAMRAGQQYSRIADSAQWNQLHYLTTGMAAEVEGYGIPRYSPLTNYYESAFCLSLDGVLMQAIQPSGPANGGAKPTTDSEYWKVAIDFNKSLIRTKVFSEVRYHVRVDGNNNNSGLEDTPQGALRDWNGVVAKALQVDFNGYDCYVHFGDGTFDTPITVLGPTFLGAYWVVIYGNDDYTWNGTSFDKGSRTIIAPSVEQLGSEYWGLRSANGASVILRNVSITASQLPANRQHYNLLAQFGGAIHLGSRISLGGYNSQNNYIYQIVTLWGGLIDSVASSGEFASDPILLNLNSHAAVLFHNAIGGAMQLMDMHTIITSGTVSQAGVSNHILTYFALGAGATVYNKTTGPRYYGSYNSVINTYGQGANRLPGNAAGSLQQGALYV